jgi:hypothetical protein
MPKKKLTFDKCGVSIHNGTLTIETSNYYNFEKHYNVSVEIDVVTNVIKVTGEKCIIECNMFGSEDGKEELFVDSAFREYKSWFGLGPVKRVLRDGWIEKKERKNVSYQSNNYIIVQNEKI